MKVNFVRPQFGISGIDSFIITLTKKLKEKQHDVDIFTGTKYKVKGIENKKYPELLSIDQEIVINGLKGRLEKFSSRLHKVAEEISKGDVVCIPNAHRINNKPLIGAIRRMNRNIPIINRVGNPIKNDEEKEQMKRSQAIMVISEKVKQNLAKHGFKERVYKIKSLLPPHFLKENKKRIKKIKNKYSVTFPCLLYPTRIGTYIKPGKISKRKGVLTAIRSLIYFLDNHQEFTFFVGGNDPINKNNIKKVQKKIVKKAEDLSIPKQKIKFLESRECDYDNFKDVVQASNFILHPNTREEPFGNAVIEAMACGKPVITTHYLGALNIMNPKKITDPEIEKGDIILVNPKAPKEIYEAVKFLLENREITTKIKENAKETALRYYGGNQVEKIIKIFKNTI